jgi:hypothetical protein
MASIVAVTAMGVSSGEAAPRTKSATIAAEAGRAVEAFHRWDATHAPVDYVRFVRARNLAAELVETELSVDGGAVVDAWNSVSVDKQQALLSAISQLGVPYRSIASKPGVGFDCSGLTSWAFDQAGLDIARVSRDQINDAEPVDRDEAEAGDLVYYPGHVSIYLGAGLMVHSPNSGSYVEITDLPDKSIRFGDAAATAPRAELAASALSIEQRLVQLGELPG